MGIQKKHIIVGGIALVSLTAAYLYWQFTKLKNSAIKFAGIKPNGISPDKLNFDLTLLFNNQSNIKIDIISQEYKVYLNNTFITTVSNTNSQIIDKHSSSPISVNVNINLKNVIEALKGSYKDIFLNPANVMLRVDVSMKVKLFGITFSFPFTYNTNLKELTANQPK